MSGKNEKTDYTSAVELLDELVEHAYSVHASDIHIEPFEKRTVIRMRLDGTITEYCELKKERHASLIARVKILSELDIAERRIPQDGHMRIPVKGEVLNIRVSVIPTVFGEKAVLRLLAENISIDYPEHFGMEEKTWQKFQTLLQSPNGMIYLTGPTGSGKSTTLYMVLEELARSRKVNVSTIEDPVEKNIPGINQMQVNNAAGLTFESGLRALLRQDPDILMIGETRDTQTAAIAVRAAITGHLVFSTLHTNDAASSVIRLKDMGLEPYLIAGALTGVIAQRLLRKVCPECSRMRNATEEEKYFLGKNVSRIPQAVGCPHCSRTGYRGRIAIHEILLVDRRVREMITQGTSVEEIKDYAVSKGMVPLKTGAARLVEEGVTTIEEMKKAAYYI